MDRRKFLGASGAVFAVGLAGCTGAFGQTAEGSINDEARDSGGLIAEDVEAAPDEATVVDATTGRLGSVNAVQTILEQLSNDDRGYALLSLDADQFETVQGALADIPYYEGAESVDGHYLRYDGDTIALYQYYRT